MAASRSCPDPHTLRLFQLGMVPGPEVDRLEQHLEQCDRCLQQLATPPAGDALLDALRAPGGVPAPPLDPEVVADMIERLKPFLPPVRQPGP
jgi:hypothetical protein